MPILKNVKIKNFKSIWEQELDLGQINIFIGSNGAGKSNLLEALGMISSAMSGEIDYSKLSERGVRLSAPDVFRSAFRNKDRKNYFSLEAKFSDLLYHANITSLGDKSKPWSFHSERLCRGDNCEEYISGRSYRGAKVKGISLPKINPYQSIVASTEALGELTDGEQEKIDALKGYAIYAPSTPILRGVSPDGSNRSPLGLYGGSLAEALNDIYEKKEKTDDLQDFFKLVDWFNTFGVTQPISQLQSSHIHTTNKVVFFRDVFMTTTFNNLYAYDVSEGALYILFLLVLVLHPKSPKIFALDNIDNCLNPSLITSLMMHISRILKSNPDKQMFMTTHNPTTLDGIDLFDNDHRLFVAKRGPDGATTFERIKPPKETTKEQWEQKYYGMKLSEIWLSGAIGGLPEGGI